MNTTPMSVKNIVITLNMPQDSFRNNFAKMTTKTGVEKMITDASESGIWRKAKKLSISPIVPTKQRKRSIIRLPSGKAGDPFEMRIGRVGRSTPRNLLKGG